MNSMTTKGSELAQLLEVMSLLRHPEHGCPWDLEQDLSSLTKYTLEEVYEVIDAIEVGDMLQLEDELGDLLFQVVFYARLTEEQGLFDFNGVAAAIKRKLIRRHPHVFPEGKIENFGRKSDLSADQVVVNWEEIKRQEREEKAAKAAASKQLTTLNPATSEQLSSILSDVPKALPALERAKKLQKRAAGVGFDWHETAPVLAKLKEEIAELEEAMEIKEKQLRDSRTEEEFGDLLFSVVNLSRHMGIDAEEALRNANAKFVTRFQQLEQAVSDDDASLSSLSLQQLDEYWHKVKRTEPD